MAEFRREIATTGSDTIDLLSVKRRVQELTNAFGRVLMREAIRHVLRPRDVPPALVAA